MIVVRADEDVLTLERRIAAGDDRDDVARPVRRIPLLEVEVARDRFARRSRRQSVYRLTEELLRGRLGDTNVRRRRRSVRIDRATAAASAASTSAADVPTTAAADARGRRGLGGRDTTRADQ